MYFLFKLKLPFSLSEKIGDVDGGEVPCQAWTTRMPKYVQPDLNFVGESPFCYLNQGISTLFHWHANTIILLKLAYQLASKNPVLKIQTLII